MRHCAAAADPGFGIYVHWPFCRAKCPYCDFNSHVGAEVDHPRWARALLGEIDRHADEIGARTLRSIFSGRRHAVADGASRPSRR